MLELKYLKGWGLCTKGDVVAIVYANDKNLDQAIDIILNAYDIKKDKVSKTILY